MTTPLPPDDADPLLKTLQFRRRHTQFGSAFRLPLGLGPRFCARPVQPGSASSFCTKWIGDSRLSRRFSLRVLIKNKRLRGTYKKQDWLAWVLPSGRIKLKHTGDIYDSPSGAAGAIKRRATSGWTFWRYLNDAHEWVPLGTLRG